MPSRPKSKRVPQSISSGGPAGLAEVSSLLAMGNAHTTHLRVTFWKVDVAPIVLGVLAFLLPVSLVVIAAVLPADFRREHAGAIEVAAKIAVGLLTR